MKEETVALINDIRKYSLEGYCVADIARLLYKDQSYIGRLAKENGIKLEAKPKKRKDKPITDGLLVIGKTLCNQRTYELRLTLYEMSEISGISVLRLSNIEMGSHNLSLLEFKKICEVYKLNPTELLNML